MSPRGLAGGQDGAKAARMTSIKAGRYAITRVLGEGAQGITYEATDRERGTVVAIKRFDVRGARSWKEIELAEREAQVLRTIDHPLVPHYLEHFEEDGALFLVMEKVEGETLEEIVKRQGPLSESEVRRFLVCADRAFSYLHGRSSPVIHRDLKPRNVIRRERGGGSEYVFVDFGAVSVELQRRSGSTVVGTLGYMAPEQLQGRAMPATDVYAIGATALAALVGADPETLPHRGLSLDVRAALQGRASEAMIQTLERMLAPDPDVRAKTIGDALDGAAFEPVAIAPLRVADTQREDAIVKSVRKLLWLLWGLSWVIVPVAIRSLNARHELVPLIMFGSLAAIIIMTWHKGAALRALLRWGSAELARESSAATRARIASSAPARVRVHATDVSSREADEPAYRDTEIAPRRGAALSTRS